MKTGIKVSGFDDLISDIGMVGERSGEAMSRVLEIAAFQTHKYAVEGIMAGGTGIVYQKYNPRRQHQASAAGQYPASDTGRLASSVQVELNSANSIRVGTALKYGAYLEFGTSKMAPRPWLMPSVEKAMVDVRREIKAGLKI